MTTDNTTMPASLPNPLLEVHQQAQAEFQSYAELEIVSTFGEPQAEYAALRKACGMIDQPQRGFLVFTGKDRLPFLNNMLTNQTWDKQTKTGLPAGQGIYAFFLNGKGRIVTDMNVLETGERTLLEMDARLIGPLMETLNKYLFAEQVTMTNGIGSLHQIALYGPGALDLLNAAAEAPVQELPLLGSAQARLFGHNVTVWRDDPTAMPGYHLIVSTEGARSVWMNLLGKFGIVQEMGRRALRPVGWAAYNAARIEGGRPIFGIDFDDSVLPAETGQFERAVSVTKGCYLGQEIVARMYARKQVARQLVGLRVAEDALPIAGSRFYDDQSNEIGGVTSSTVSPILSNAPICLGLLKKPFFAPDTVVNVPAEGSMRKATVVPTPFVRQ